MEVENRELTYGEKAVGLKINPGKSDEVTKIKQGFADLIDEMYNLKGICKSGEGKRLASIAITEAQTAQMWAVKALTWED